MNTQLINGDCLQEMAKIPDGSIDLIVTSPPYDNLRTYNENISQWNNEKWKGIIRKLYYVTKQGGVVVWIVSDATINGSETGTSFKQALWAKECGFNLHDTMIWNKGSFTGVGSLAVRYAPTWEYMFIFSKGSPKTFNPIKDKLNKQPGKLHPKKIRNVDGRMKDGSNPNKRRNEYGQRFSIWDQSPLYGNNTLHPAVFPEKLAHDHIISWSNKGDIVLDCFMGSGTTGVACKKTNRNFIGIELDKTYFDIASKRIAETIDNTEPFCLK
jgi:DNA modification methylase